MTTTESGRSAPEIESRVWNCSATASPATVSPPKTASNAIPIERCSIRTRSSTHRASSSTPSIASQA